MVRPDLRKTLLHHPHFKRGGIRSRNMELIDPDNADKNVERAHPHAFSSQMQVMINSLNQMPLSDNHPPVHTVFPCNGNSLMFQRLLIR